MSETMRLVGLSISLAWLGLLLIWGIVRYMLRYGRTEDAGDGWRRPVIAPPDNLDGRTCAVGGCDRYAYWVWHSANLTKRLVVCTADRDELLAMRGGFAERLPVL